MLLSPTRSISMNENKKVLIIEIPYREEMRSSFNIKGNKRLLSFVTFIHKRWKTKKDKNDLDQSQNKNQKETNKTKK